MPLSNDPSLDQEVLDMIERSPTGSVPRTPTFDDAVARLRASQQIFSSADHKDCHVTARSLAKLPVFCAKNLKEFLAADQAGIELEPNNSIYDRYLQSLSPAVRQRAEGFRLIIAGRPVHHRIKTGQGRDPLHSIFLIPGGGPHVGYPGNYLHGLISEKPDASQTNRCSITICDAEHDTASFEASSVKEAAEKLDEVLESIPFHLTELEALGFSIH
jgi:hypothetical protein